MKYRVGDEKKTGKYAQVKLIKILKKLKGGLTVGDITFFRRPRWKKRKTLLSLAKTH